MIKISRTTLTVFGIPIKFFAGPHLYKQFESFRISCVSTILAVPNHKSYKRNSTLDSASDPFARPLSWNQLGLGSQDDPIGISPSATPASGWLRCDSAGIASECAQRGETGTGPIHAHARLGLSLSQCHMLKGDLVNSKEGSSKAESFCNYIQVRALLAQT